MAGQRGAVWLFGEVLTVAYEEEPLAQYQVKYARESQRIAALTEERIYPPRFPSPQPICGDSMIWNGTPSCRYRRTRPAAITAGSKSRRDCFPEQETVKNVSGICTLSSDEVCFSGGMKRRVGIAQALLNDPQLLIVDEPTAGLDPEERIRFRNLLADLAGNRTILLSTHIVEDVAQTCRVLAVLANGHLHFHGSVAELVQAARGKVWIVTTDGPKPDGDFIVVSTLHLGASVQYRVVGEPSSLLGATPAEPSLEDGYVWLMQTQQVTPAAFA